MAAVLSIPCILPPILLRPRCSIRNKFAPFAGSPTRDLKTSPISIGPRWKSSKGVPFAVEDDRASAASAVAEKPEGGEDEGVGDGGRGGGDEGKREGEEDKQEVDWKDDEEFKKFMGSPSIEAAIKLEKKRADRKLKELDRESGSGGNLLARLINAVVRDSLTKEKERLEKAEEAFVALDLNKVKEISKGMSVILTF